MLLLIPRACLLPFRKSYGKAAGADSSEIKRCSDVINPAPAVAYNEVEGASNDLLRTGAIEVCTLACPSRVLRQRLVPGPGHGIVRGHFENVSNWHYGRRRVLRWNSVYNRNVSAAAVARRIPDSRPSFDDV